MELEERTWPRDLDFRRLLTWYVVSRGRVVTVAELAGMVEDAGLALSSERTSKVVSDRLRADVARGRLHRVGRGRYVGGRIPSTTWRRMEASAQIALAIGRRRRTSSDGA